MLWCTEQDENIKRSKKWNIKPVKRVRHQVHELVNEPTALMKQNMKRQRMNEQYSAANDAATTSGTGDPLLPIDEADEMLDIGDPDTDSTSEVRQSNLHHTLSQQSRHTSSCHNSQIIEHLP